MSYQLIGRACHYEGKSLWEILGNLKNFGVGRLVIRNRFQRYPEPCYFKILKVAALPQPPDQPYQLDRINRPQLRKCRVLVERVFRGQKYHQPVQLEEVTHRPDFKLVPKDEEHKYLNYVPFVKEEILPRTMELPPLLREIMIRNMKAKGIPITEEPQMEIYYNRYGHKRKRVAEENEKPTITLSIGLGTPANPQLYADLKPI